MAPVLAIAGIPRRKLTQQGRFALTLRLSFFLAGEDRLIEAIRKIRFDASPGEDAAAGIWALR
jgi:hypothetical protein